MTDGVETVVRVRTDTFTTRTRIAATNVQTVRMEVFVTLPLVCATVAPLVTLVVIIALCVKVTTLDLSVSPVLNACMEAVIAAT